MSFIFYYFKIIVIEGGFMSLLAKRSMIKEDKSNIITLGAIAKEKKKQDPTVINATIGMLYDESGKLFTFRSVDRALNELTPDQKYAYASTPGGVEFHEAIKHWIFREYYDEFEKNTFVGVMATPGGSGAISNTFGNYLNENDVVLLPSYMWGNYKQFAYENYAQYVIYELFDENGNFNLEDLYSKMEKVKQQQNRIVLVINDPCQNPTGYTMKDWEWEKLLDKINELSMDQTPIILLHDMAYIDYDYRGLESTRKNIRRYQKMNDSVLVVLAFSGSKTLALYGLRVGAQIAISRNKNNIEEFNRANKFSSRAKWSNTTNLGMNLVTKVLTDSVLRKEFEEELEFSRNTLIQRADMFLSKAKEVGLKTLPFECGFFITIPCENAEEVYKRLVEKKIHIIPMGNVLRVTIASITLKECEVLPKYIKECMEMKG